MSEEIHVKAKFTAEDEATAVVRKLRREVDGLSASLRKAFTFAPATDILKSTQRLADRHGEIAGQLRRQTAELRTARAAQRALNVEVGKAGRLHAVGGRAEVRRQSEILSLNRDQLGFMSKMARQRAQEDRRRDVEHRNIIRRLDRERSASERVVGSPDRRAGGVGRGIRSVGSNVNRARNRLDSQFFNSPTSYAMAAAGATAAMATSAFSTFMKTDTSETNLKMFGGLSDTGVNAMRKDWGDKAAIQFGVGAARMLDVATEALKAGLPENVLRPVTESVLRAATALDMDTANAIKLAGRSATLLTKDMKTFDPDTIRVTMNAIAVAAKESAADANEIVAANRRASSAMVSTKMSMSDLTAFNSAGISADMPSGKVGTFMGFLTSEIVGSKFARGQRGNDLQQAFGILGMGSRGNASQKMADNPTETIMTILNKMGGMTEVKRTQVASLLGMREWRDELLTLVNVRDDIDRIRQAQKDRPNFIDEASEMRMKSIRGRWDSVVAQFSLVWEKIGSGFKSAFIDAGDVFNEIGRTFDFEFFSRHVRNAMDGFVRGFGFDTVRQMARSLFGSASGGLDMRGLDSTFRFFRGFAEGLKEAGKLIMTVIKTVGTAFGFDTSTAEGIGKLAAQFMALSISMHFLRPVFSIFGLVKDGLMIIAGAVTALWGALKVAGLLGGAGAAAAGGGMAGLATLATRLAGMTFVGGALAVAVWNWPKITEAKEAVTNYWDYLANGPKDPAQAKAIEEAKKQQKGPFEVLGKALKELFGINSAKAGELPEGYKNPDAVKAMAKSAEKISTAFDQAGARFQLAGLTGGAGLSASIMGGYGGSGGGNAFVGGSSSIGNGVVNARGLGRRGILGGAYSSGTPGAGLFDSIINAEGTAKGGRDPYNTVLGYGKWGSPSKNLTDMTLNEVKEFGLSMRRRQAEQGTPWKDTSSASGAFQIVGTTMMDAAKALGLDQNSTKFTPDVQRQMAAWIAKSQGLGAWQGFKGHPGELAKARSAMTGGSDLTGLAAGLIPVKTSGGGTTMMEPKAGFGQAFGGGATHAGVLAAAQAITGNIAGGVNRFTGFNDVAHLGRNSKHNLGLAGDFTLKDPSKSAETAEQLRTMFRGAGLKDEMFRVIDEYRNPSPFSTGGHLHYQFNSQEAADKYAAHERAKSLAASQPSASGIASSIPTPTAPSARPGGMFDPNGGAGNSGFSAPITIHGGGQSAEEIALQVQRRMEQAMRWRTHDYESELT